MGWFTTFMRVITFGILELTQLSRNKEAINKTTTLADFNFPTIEETRVQPIIWGTVLMKGPNIVWYDDLSQRAILNQVKTGLFSSDTQILGYAYTLGMQFAFCRGPVDSIRKINIDTKNVFDGTLTHEQSYLIDNRTLFGGRKGTGGVEATFRFHDGRSGQSANTYLTGHQVVNGQTPTYSGLAYGVIEAGYIGNTTQLKIWEFELTRLPKGTNGVTTKAINTIEANPVYVLYEIMTNDEWGLGYPGADFDNTIWEAAADTVQTEGNGFSMILDREIEIQEMIKIVEEQIDGVAYLNQRTGKWEIKLVRDDYVVSNLRQINDDNVIEVLTCQRSSWEDTVNNVVVEYADREQDYREIPATAQDMANFQVTQRLTTKTMKMPGVKDATLASDIATRELIANSSPLLRIELKVNREFWDIGLAEAVKFSNARLGITDVIMRTAGVDFGSDMDNEITITMVEDLFGLNSGVFTPPSSDWVPPTSSLVAIPSGDSIAIESPKALSDRDPDSVANQRPYRVWAAARNQGDGAVDFDIRTRVSTNPYFTGDTINEFMRVGTLAANLDQAMTDATVTVVPTDTDILDFVSEVPDTTNGRDLIQLIYVGPTDGTGEFMLYKNAVANGNNIDLSTVYRGVLDTLPQNHTSGTKVFFVHIGAGIDFQQYANGDDVDVHLIPKSRDEELPEGSATTLTVTMDNRHVRPYPAGFIKVNGASVYAGAPHSLEYTGTGNDKKLQYEFSRRDYARADELYTHLTGDVAPANTTYENQVEIYLDGVLQKTVPWATGLGGLADLTRKEVIKLNAGVTDNIKIVVKSRHTVDAVVYEGRITDEYLFDTSSELDDFFYFGELVGGSWSTLSWTAPDTGDYTVDIDAPASTGILRIRKGVSIGVDVITGDGVTTSGTTAGLNVQAGDTLEIRSSAAWDVETVAKITPPISALGAYAVTSS